VTKISLSRLIWTMFCWIMTCFSALSFEDSFAIVGVCNSNVAFTQGHRGEFDNAYLAKVVL